MRHKTLHNSPFALFLFMSIALWISGCTQQNAMTDQEVQQIQTELKSIMAEQQELWNNGNLEGFMSYYWNNDSLKFITSNGVRIGWNKVLDGYKKGFPNRDDMGELSFDLAHINVIAPDLATVSGRWEVDRTWDALDGGFSLIFRKLDDEGWKIVQDFTY